MDRRFDLVSIGGGTAGLIATHGVAGIGGRAALIERARLGGDCLWTGCVPSKALIAAASTAHTMRTADRHGFDPVEPNTDFRRVMATVRRAQELIEPHDSPERVRAQGAEVIEGSARFAGPGRIEVDGRVVSYRAALIATGTRPVIPAVEGIGDADPLTSETVWGLESLPNRLTVLGGGPVGCELGQAFSRLGSTVTIVESGATLLPRQDPDVGAFLATRFGEEGIDVRTGVEAHTVTSDGDGWRLTLSDGSSVTFDRILVATGHQPNTSDLGLETVGVELDEDGHVVVDDCLATTGDRIFAAGDVTGAMPFTPVAANHARLVLTNALLRTRRRVDYDKIPWAVFTDPEVARIGLDAETARNRWGRRAVVQRFGYDQLDRAVSDARAHGWAELIGDPKRRLVGATIVGAAAGESIAEVAAWIANGAKIDAVSTTVHVYPTYSEGPSRVADDILRARYFNPRLTAVTSRVLAGLRRIDKPKGN